MPGKMIYYQQLAEAVTRQIAGDPQEWARFLTTAARLYKYPYHEQLLIYAQRPDATACAGYDLWNNTMHRYVRRGSKGNIIKKFGEMTDSGLSSKGITIKTLPVAENKNSPDSAKMFGEMKRFLSARQYGDTGNQQPRRSGAGRTYRKQPHALHTRLLDVRHP